MREKADWSDRYKLSISEELTIKQIQLLMDCSQNKAQLIRKECVKYCKDNGIKIDGKRIRTDIVLLICQKDINYYFNKMELSSKVI